MIDMLLFLIIWIFVMGQMVGPDARISEEEDWRSWSEAGDDRALDNTHWLFSRHLVWLPPLSKTQGGE
jgi:hypothetical protein